MSHGSEAEGARLPHPVTAPRRSESAGWVTHRTRELPKPSPAQPGPAHPWQRRIRIVLPQRADSSLPEPARHHSAGQSSKPAHPTQNRPNPTHAHSTAAHVYPALPAQLPGPETGFLAVQAVTSASCLRRGVLAGDQGPPEPREHGTRPSSRRDRPNTAAFRRRASGAAEAACGARRRTRAPVCVALAAVRLPRRDGRSDDE